MNEIKKGTAMKVSSQTRPEPVTIEHAWNGKLKARFAENITQSEETDDNPSTYLYDEYTYTADYSDQLAAAICANRDYYLNLTKEQEKYSGLTPVEIAKKMLEETAENNE